MSSYDIPFNTSNLSYILLLPCKTFKLFDHILTLAIPRGAFAPKNRVSETSVYPTLQRDKGEQIEQPLTVLILPQILKMEEKKQPEL